MSWRQMRCLCPHIPPKVRPALPWGEMRFLCIPHPSQSSASSVRRAPGRDALPLSPYPSRSAGADPCSARPEAGLGSRFGCSAPSEAGLGSRFGVPVLGSAALSFSTARLRGCPARSLPPPNTFTPARQPLVRMLLTKGRLLDRAGFIVAQLNSSFLFQPQPISSAD